jgi:hypothetical protein
VLTVAFSLVLSLISGRTGANFIPCREYGAFTGPVETLAGRAAGANPSAP